MILQSHTSWMGAEWLVVAIVVVAVVVQALKAKRPPQISYPYRLRPSVLTPAELQFYRALRQATDAVICTKVRVADVLQTPRDQRAAFLRISQKHVDFLLCDPVMLRPLLAVELDDRSHERADCRARDEFIDKAYAAAGLPILHVRTRQAYRSDELAKQIGELIG